MTAATKDEIAGIPWWLVLIEGIALIIIGALFLFFPYRIEVLMFVIKVLGIYWIISGVFQLIVMFMDHTAWGWKLFAGLLGILAGIVVLGSPLWSSVIVLATMVIIMGIQGIVYGGIGLYQAFKGGGWGQGILSAISILFGFVLLANVMIGAAVLPWVLAVFAIVGGIFAVIAAFKLR
jgi:uncharacterized membrane protein HdeD (DUF308 family)